MLLVSIIDTADAHITPSRATTAGNTPFTKTAAYFNGQTIDLTLSDAIYLGLRDNRVIRSAYLDRVSQKYDLRVAEDQFTSKLVLSGSYISTRNQTDRSRQASTAQASTLLTPYGTRVSLGWAYQHTQANKAGLLRNDGANIAVIQPLLRGAGREVATAPVKIARLNEQINRLSLKLTVSHTITQVISSYRELLRTQEQLQIAGNALERARTLIEVNRALIAAGRMAEFEIVQTEAELATQELAYEESRNRLDMARLALLQLLALDLNTQIVATDVMRAQRVDVNAAYALRQAEGSQPAYLTQLIASEQAAVNLTVARNNRLWDLSLVGGAGQVRDRHAFGTSRRWENYVGLELQIPFGDLTRRQAEVQAQVRVRNQDVALAQARQQLELDVANALRDLGTRWRQFEIAERALALSRRKLEIEREKLGVGRSSNFQVLSFDNDLRNAENSRLNALIAYLNAQAQLDQSLGTTLESWGVALND